MTAIVSSIEIASPPETVFAYATDPSRFSEWQKGVVSGATDGDHPGVGSKCSMTRKIGGAERTTSSEITEIDPPSRWAVHGIDGPIRADVHVTVEPLDLGAGSRVTVGLDFKGHGIGKLLAPLVARQARTEVPKSCQNLKNRLERTT